jgi:hypothetical protein
MTDRREVIRNAASWAVALSMAMALSTTQSEAQPSRRPGPPPPPRSAKRTAMGLGSPASLLVGPAWPAVPLVVMGALLADGNRRVVSRARQRTSHAHGMFVACNGKLRPEAMPVRRF